MSFPRSFGAPNANVSETAAEPDGRQMLGHITSEAGLDLLARARR